MTTPPAKAAATAQRSRVSIPEAMARLGWNENDLKEAIISGHIVPSTFVHGPVWPMPVGTKGQRKRTATAEFINGWMFAVGVRPVGPFDCEFEFLARTPDAIESSADVYTLAESGYVKAHIRLSDIMQNGAVDVEQLSKLEAGQAAGPLDQQVSANGGRGKWWHTDHDPWAMAETIEEEAKHQNSDLNQRGRRHGSYPLTTLAAKVAAKIKNSEILTGKRREIGAKTIENFLRKSGWE